MSHRYRRKSIREKKQSQEMYDNFHTLISSLMKQMYEADTQTEKRQILRRASSAINQLQSDISVELNRVSQLSQSKSINQEREIKYLNELLNSHKDNMTKFLTYLENEKSKLDDEEMKLDSSHSLHEEYDKTHHKKFLKVVQIHNDNGE